MACGVARWHVALLDGMLAIDPKERLTMPAVLSHPWLKEAEEPIYRGAADQGSYNMMGEVDDDEGPRYYLPQDLLGASPMSSVSSVAPLSPASSSICPC